MRNFKSGHDDESLENHINETNRQYNILKQNIKFENIINKCTKEEISIKTLINILDSVIIYHDYGKLNPYFQEYIQNQKYQNNKLKTGHSKIGCIKYINDMYLNYISNNDFGKLSGLKLSKVKKVISIFILNCAYNIWKHHNRTGIQNRLNFDLFINDLIDYYNRYTECFINIDIDIKNLEYFKTISNNFKFENPIISYLLFKLNYALLVTSDYLATYNYYHKKDLVVNRIDKNTKERLNNNFNSNEIISNIYKFKSKMANLSEINQYRAKMFLESEDNLLKNINQYIYFLEAPTGSGKSTISINLALKLLNEEFNRIIYVSPLNNIAEQMYDGTKEKLKTKHSEIALINNRESIIYTDEYSKDYLNYQTFNYPIIMTSHVKLFDILFGNHRKDLLALNSLRNSILILDEIQNYKNKIWIHFINMFSQIARVYNIKIIIMSATLPKMDKLLREENIIKTINLIHNTNCYFNFFKNRVKYDYSLLDKSNKKEKNTIQEVINKVENVIQTTNKHRILIETLSTKTCEELYEYFKKYENKGFLIFKILSVTNLKVRKRIIKDIQEKIGSTYKNKKIILVGTQCIEAGIDIDMNVGFKDISILDFDEQFIGRIERNFNDIGVCYFFDLDNEDFIYKDDYRIEYNLKTSLEYRKIFESKKFNEYYKNTYEWLNRKEGSNYDDFINNLNDLQYENIHNTMKLIDNNTYSFLFLNKLKDDNDIYDCKNILTEYKYIKQNINKYSEKKIKLKEVQKELNNFTYNLPAYKFKEEPILEKVNGYYIVENGERYFDNVEDNNLTTKSNLNLGMFVENCSLFI
ncbi:MULTISPECIES: CRISPR-associated helicase Cas3' [unclassified Clostridium]|uniref:CRISPR-associated helicase Cas3' n=1 Tax=unclassified Clostridium TaxID=2614128 RepID=UPI00207A6295|nr:MULTISPECIES: CRISPR-associated helicase Cas3' [unclassified Clostridium]